MAYSSCQSPIHLPIIQPGPGLYLTFVVQNICGSTQAWVSSGPAFPEQLLSTTPPRSLSLHLYQPSGSSKTL